MKLEKDDSPYRMSDELMNDILVVHAEGGFPGPNLRHTRARDMSGTLLGFPGPWAKDNREPSDHYTTKIGGLPDWPFNKDTINPTLLNCNQCGSQLCLVAQIYAPISSKDLMMEERFLLVFGCVTPNCGSTPLSWRVLRIQKPENVNDSSSSIALETPSTPVSVSKSNCLEDDEEIDLEELEKAFAELASLTPKPKKSNSKQHSKAAAKRSSLSPQIRSVDADTPVMPCFYVYGQEETSTWDVASTCPNNSLLSIKEKQTDIDDAEQGETWEAESYEYDKALTADRTYLKFKKKLDSSPEQCFRYSFGGNPLLATKVVDDPGKCPLCSASRHFEMQLMAPLIYFLLEKADSHQRKFLEDWNWLTLAVYTCSKSCSTTSDREKSGYGDWIIAEEAVMLQSDQTLQECSQLGYFS